MRSFGSHLAGDDGRRVEPVVLVEDRHLEVLSAQVAIGLKEHVALGWVLGVAEKLGIRQKFRIDAEFPRVNCWSLDPESP